MTDHPGPDGPRPFDTEQDLRQWLDRHGIDTSRWGTGVHKSVSDLWRECLGGETVLDEDLPGRTTRIVKVIVRRGGRILIEAAQTMANGERRPRNAVPMEKMKPGESVREAALRCVREELGVAAGDSGDRVSPESSEKPVATETRLSTSYPGLPTRYTFYRYELDVPGLPDGPFITDEAGDAVRKHFWEWRDGD